MSAFSAVVAYILIWWVTLFAVLPTGVRGQAEDGDITHGTEPGAPTQSRMKHKLLLTTVVTTILWGIFCAVIISGLIDVRDFDAFKPPEG